MATATAPNEHRVIPDRVASTDPVAPRPERTGCTQCGATLAGIVTGKSRYSDIHRCRTVTCATHCPHCDILIVAEFAADANGRRIGNRALGLSAIARGAAAIEQALLAHPALREVLDV